MTSKLTDFREMEIEMEVDTETKRQRRRVRKYFEDLAWYLMFIIWYLGDYNTTRDCNNRNLIQIIFYLIIF